MVQSLPFEILGHTADLRVHVTGKTREDLFRHALQGMGAVIKKEEHEGKHPPWRTHRDIVVDAQDQNSLLVDFLNEALYLANIHHEVYRDTHIFELSETGVEGELVGDAADGFDEDIKAVTYHEAEIKKNPAGYFEVTIIFDI